jgi:arginyl-tRNA--protein-N-Asp/Glu arginylyltransferase
MIYYDIHTPATMPAALLDEYLAKGWYRMQQTIFTTDVIIKNELIIPVFWLRLVLKRYNETKTSRKIIELNKDCTVTITNGTTITAEAEELYQLYKSSVTFEVSPTITDYLLGDTIESIYNTHCIEIRLQDQLIALGYFDEGANSLAGILNIYHPGFKNRSLGKYLMLLKINYALEKQLPFYYPGYISTSYAKFDYKLFPGKEAMEVYISSTRQWRPWLSVTAEELEELLFMSNNGEQSY